MNDSISLAFFILLQRIFSFTFTSLILLLYAFHIIFDIYINWKSLWRMCAGELCCIAVLWDVSFASASASSSYSIFVCSHVQRRRTIWFDRQDRRDSSGTEHNTADRSENGLYSPISINDCYHANMIHGLSTLSTILYKFPVYMHGKPSICCGCSLFFPRLCQNQKRENAAKKYPAQQKQCATQLSQHHVHTHIKCMAQVKCKSRKMLKS